MTSHSPGGRTLHNIALIALATIFLACNADVQTTQAPAPSETSAPPTASIATDAPTAVPTSAPTQTPTDTLAPTETPTPTATATATPRPAAPSSTATPSELSFIWEIVEAGVDPNNPNQWRAVFTITASGGDGRYSYFHDALPLDDSTFEVLWEACRSKPGSMSVQDGSGQSVSEEYFFNAPYCNRTPTPTP